MTWRKGMKAVCIRRGSCLKETPRGMGPRPNDILDVQEVRNVISRTNGEPYTVLAFAEFPGGGYDANCFRPAVERTQEQDIALFAPFLAGADPDAPEVPTRKNPAPQKLPTAATIMMRMDALRGLYGWDIDENPPSVGP